MTEDNRVEKLLEDVEQKGQTVIDEANLLDSWIVTYVIIKEGWKWIKRGYRWLRVIRGRDE